MSRPTSAARARRASALLERLEGGTRRSLGDANAIVIDVLEEPALLGVIFHAAAGDDPVVRMRAADIAEKVTCVRPEGLRSHARAFARLIEIEQPEVRWHVALMWPRLKLSAAARRGAVNTLISWLDERSAIVRTHAMQALFDFMQIDRSLRKRILPILRECAREGTPAMRARGRKLLAKLDSTAAVRKSRSSHANL